MTEPSIETNGVLVKHFGYTVQVHRNDHDNAWTFRIDNPTIYRDVVPTYGYTPAFENQTDAIQAATRYLSYLHQFTEEIETAQTKFKNHLNEFPVINNLQREKRSYEAVNG